MFIYPQAKNLIKVIAILVLVGFVPQSTVIASEPLGERSNLGRDCFVLLRLRLAVLAMTGFGTLAMTDTLAPRAARQSVQIGEARLNGLLAVQAARQQYRKLDSVWGEALRWTAAKEHLKDEDEVVKKLRAFDKPAHSRFRYKLAKSIAEDLGAFSDGVRRIWTIVIGSSTASYDDIQPSSDIDFVIEVDSEEERVKASKYLEVVSRYLTKKFNAVMSGTGIKIFDLIDVVDKILLPEDIAQGEGFAAAVKSIHTPHLLLYDAARSEEIARKPVSQETASQAP